jgi:hypothetical protein
VNRQAILRKDANILSRHWVFGFITNNPIRVDPLTAESVIIAPNAIIVIIMVMNGKRFKARSLIGRFCDISEKFFGTLKLVAPKFNCKNSE